MSRDQLSLADLLPSLDGSDLQEVERVRAAVNLQLSTERGGAALSSLVDYYLDCSSPQAVLLLSSIREAHHKALLEKLNEALSRPGSRLAAVTLLGHLIRKQPPWVHLISQSALLPSLLRCLKTEGDVVFLVSGVLVLVTLLPMIPQAGRQHLFDFFDVFGRLASWSHRNPGQVAAAHLVHLQAGVYSLFHRLYGMFPCSFMSYLRLHYSMKENRDAFQELVKPMLDHVRVHPELVTGSQDSELDPSRWRSYEVHDIVIECSRLSLDPLESSWEDQVQTSCPPRPEACPAPPQLDLSSTCPLQVDDVTWSPSSQCGLSTPPPEPSDRETAPPLSRCSSTSGVPAVAPPPDQLVASVARRLQETQPIPSPEGGDVIGERPSAEAPPPRPEAPPPGLRPDVGPAPPAHLGLASPQAPTLFRKAQEGQEGEGPGSISPLKALDQMIVHGQDAHRGLSRVSVGGKPADRSPSGGPAQGEELQALRVQLLLVHSQLQYERFGRQQHAVRNRRLLRRVLSAAALEEHSAAMEAQLSVQDQEIRSLKASLEQEHSRLAELRQDATNQSQQLLSHNQQLLAELEEQRRAGQRQRTELQDSQSRLGDLEAELQRANNKAYNAEHQLTQLSLKLSSSEQQQLHLFLLNQQLLLLREANRTLSQQLDHTAHSWTEESMLQCTLGKELQRLKEGDVQHRQKLEAANHRIAELEAQLARKEQLVLDQKKLLEDSKNQSRAELGASEGRCAALRAASRGLQTQMLQLFSRVEAEQRTSRGGASRSSSLSRPRPSPAVGILNGAAEALCSSPLHLPPSSPLHLPSSPLHLPSSPLHLPSPSSSSPIESPLAVGSFLEQRARELFGPSQSQEEEEEQEEEEQEEEEQEEEEQEEEARLESPPLGQEVEEATLLAGSPQLEPPGQEEEAQQRRSRLSIMDYDQMLPEF